ncbi:MAG: hypothetical protein AEth_01078 [Candidatus Argoarchaeum ethanivorans]|uniref:DUF11 domain-containing protein n=1 Tax=Candidatus Argoarchaeum ethanivorans TaxID=2608793 RepID=A0A8B3S1L6_9EURY|nr:MAG: hypothetical protein AEth_01078 [Candidatus Argoarchaeum ethanivorans]
MTVMKHSMNKYIPLILITLFFISVICACQVASASDRISLEFPLETGDSIYFEDGYYKVTLVGTEWQFGWALLSISCDGCLYEQREVYGRKNQTIHYPTTDSPMISITDTIDVSRDSARVTISFPEHWSRKLVTAEEVKEETKPVTVPKLLITKSVDKTTIKLGDIIQVTVIVENVGNGSANDIAIIESPSAALVPLGSGLRLKVKDPLPAGESDDDAYSVESVKSGTFEIPRTVVTYYSESKEKYTAESDAISIKVLAPEVRVSNLETTIQFDNVEVLKGAEIAAITTIKNTGDAPANSITLINKIPAGLELVSGEVENTYFEIKPGEMRELTALVKAKEAGNYTFNPRTVYNDGETTITSQTIVVTKKVVNYKKYLYLVPVGLIIALIVWFLIKRHKEYSF